MAARRTSRQRPRRPRFEPLENRYAPADLGLGIVLLENNVVANPGGGTRNEPGNVLGPTDTITQNDLFWVAIEVEDLRAAGDPGNTGVPSQAGQTVNGGESLGAGVIGLPLDVIWNDTILSFSAENITPNAGGPTSIPTTNALVSTLFPRGRFVEQVNSDSLELLRGFSIPAVDGANSVLGGAENAANIHDRRFSLILMEATGVGQSDFTLDVEGSVSFADGAALDGVQAIHPENSCAVASEQNLSVTCSVTVVAPDPTLGSLTGFVYADTNSDGIFDRRETGAASELGLPNVLIQLQRLNPDGSVDQQVAEMRTGPDGLYHFEGLEAADYRIEQIQPANYRDGDETLGSLFDANGNLLATPGTVGNDSFDVTVGQGDNGTDYNFAENLNADQINKRFFLTSTPTMLAMLCPSLNVTCASFNGTDQDDTISITRDATGIQAIINGVNATIPAATELVIVDGRGGDDSVTVTGNTDDETSHVDATTISLRPDTVDLVMSAIALNTEQHQANLAGNDLAILRDSDGDDQLVLLNGTAVLTRQDLGRTSTASNAATVRAFTRSGSDSSNDQGGLPAVDLQLLGPWTVIP